MPLAYSDSDSFYGLAVKLDLFTWLAWKFCIYNELKKYNIPTCSYKKIYIFLETEWQ